jgi:hypothetical protein
VPPQFNAPAACLRLCSGICTHWTVLMTCAATHVSQDKVATRGGLLTHPAPLRIPRDSSHAGQFTAPSGQAPGLGQRHAPLGDGVPLGPGMPMGLEKS